MPILSMMGMKQLNPLSVYGAQKIGRIAPEATYDSLIEFGRSG